MLIRQAFLVSGALQSLQRLMVRAYVDGAKVYCNAVPECEENPFPKDAIPEVDFQLSGLIDLRVFKGVLVIDILKVEC